jgi:hypothetical protein
MMRAHNYDRVWIPARFLDRLQMIHDDMSGRAWWWWFFHPSTLIRHVNDVRGLLLSMLNQRPGV